MILGADTEDEAVIPIYEATDPGFLHWTYRGDLTSWDRDTTRFAECPNFTRIGDKWVLVYSPQTEPNAVKYAVGSFNLDTLRFTQEHEGLVDHPENFLYATNTLHDALGRSVLLARIKNFQEGRGWSGCMALPRVLSVDS